MMKAVHIFLFGKFSMQFEDETLIELDSHKTKELFCFLLLHRHSPIARERLADLLWSDATSSQSKSYLRKALWQLQTALEDCKLPDGRGLLLVEPEWIEFNSGASYWIDVINFEQAFKSVQGKPGQELDQESAQMLQEAVRFYRGELLEGCYWEWCLYHRERLQHYYQAILDKLMKFYEAQGNYELGISYGMQALLTDPARERTHRRLMRLKYLAGYRAEALRQYDRCAAILQEEFGVSPLNRPWLFTRDFERSQIMR